MERSPRPRRSGCDRRIGRNGPRISPGGPFQLARGDRPQLPTRRTGRSKRNRLTIGMRRRGQGASGFGKAQRVGGIFLRPFRQQFPWISGRSGRFRSGRGERTPPRLADHVRAAGRTQQPPVTGRRLGSHFGLALGTPHPTGLEQGQREIDQTGGIPENPSTRQVQSVNSAHHRVSLTTKAPRHQGKTAGQTPTQPPTTERDAQARYSGDPQISRRIRPRAERPVEPTLPTIDHF